MKIVSLSLDIKGTSAEILNKLRCLSKAFVAFVAAIFSVIISANYAMIQVWYTMGWQTRIVFDTIYDLSLLFIIVLIINFSVMSFGYLKTVENKDLLKIKSKFAFVSFVVFITMYSMIG